MGWDIGDEFTLDGQEQVWRVTDVGTRTVIAIKLDMKDQSWYNGPPYAVTETVFDEDDIGGMEKVDER